MIQHSINYLAFGVFIQAFILFIEVLIFFKRPLGLKIVILILAIALAWRGLGVLYFYHYHYTRWAIEMPTSLLAGAIISFFALIYENKLKWPIILIGVVVFFIQFAYQIYYTLIVPVDVKIPLSSIEGAGTIIKILKVGFVLLASTIIIRTMIKIFKKYDSGNIYFLQLRKWTFYLLVFLMLNMICFVLNQLSNNPYQNIFFLILLIMNFFSLILLLLRPKFLNNSDLKVKLSNSFNIKEESEISIEAFISIFFTQLYFLKKEATFEDLKSKLNASSDQLNKMIYDHYQMSFTDLINKNRIKYFIDLVHSGDYTNYTIEALAKKSGFNSRFHLYKSFKKFHGGTPSDFIRSVAK